METMSASVLIDVSIHAVWEALCELQAYPSWSPLVVAVSGPERLEAVGQRASLTLALSTGRQSTTRQEVAEFYPPVPDAHGHAATLLTRDVGWMAALGLVLSERAHRLQQPMGRPTRLYIEQSVDGPLRSLLPVEALQEGLERHAAALKDHCEASWTHGGSPRTVR